MAAAARQRLVVQAGATAFLTAVAILFTGQVIFETPGITADDLRVGGGLVLLVLSITDIVFGDYKRRGPSEGSGGGAEEAGAGQAAALGVVCQSGSR